MHRYLDSRTSTVWRTHGGDDLEIHVSRVQTVIRAGTTLNSESFTWSPLPYLINPSLLNLFMKKLTRDRVVLIISASVS